MKKIHLISLFLFLCSFAFGQSAPLVMSTKVTINSVTVFTDPYTVTGVTNDVTSNWTASDISAGDSLYLEDGSELRVYQVVSISSAVGTAFTIVINDLNNTGSLPTTGVGALYRGTTNYDYPVWTAGISETLQSMIDNRFKQRLDALLKGIGTDYITTDSFSTFTNGSTFASIPLDKTVWSTTRGSKWEKTGAGTMTRRSTDNGLNASTIANTSNDTLIFNSNLNNRVQMTTGNVSAAYVLDPLYYTSQAVGETFVIGIQAGTSDVTVNWSSVFGIYTGTTFSGMPTTIVPAQSVMTFTFRVITTSSEIVKFHYTDGINVSNGDSGIDTLANYTALRAYTGTSNAVIINRNTYGGLFRRVFTGTENGGTLIVASNGVKWNRVFDGKTYSPAFWEVGGYDHNGTTAAIINNRDKLNSCIQAAGAGATIQLEKDTTYLIDILIPLVAKNLKIEANGATLKRFDTPITTLTATESIGSTVIDVVSTTGFRVGQRIMITDTSATNNGLGFNENIGAASSHIITALTGTTLTIGNALLVGATAGDSLFVITSFFENNTSVDLGNLTFENAIFDGNKANNQHTYDWRLNNTISLGSNGSRNIVFENCNFRDIPNENIFGCGATFRSCTFKRLMGSVYHQSRNLLIESDTITKQKVSFLQCEADSICLGDNALQSHSEAMFTHSAKTRLYEVIGGRYTRINGLIFSGFDADGEFGILVDNAYFENTKGLFSCSIASNDTTGWNINFSNSYFINCGDATIYGRAVQTGKVIYRVNFINNTFVNARIYFRDFAQSIISGNKFYTETPYATGTTWAFTGWASALTSQNAMIQFEKFTGLRFENNEVYGPQTYSAFVHTGVMLQINGATLTSDTKIL
jgi:hypothetical protein